MFYVRVATRSSGAAAQGSPRQALGYLADNHDREHDAGSSEAELNYIARLDPGWKTDLEGGRVPLVGYGTLKGVTEDQPARRPLRGRLPAPPRYPWINRLQEPDLHLA